ncbi:MAG: hypothetical protein ISR50_03125 [Alphaproteobacteria bacterium]|nr:hypothetical protein [Alphaproteobacteria bacterium]
MTQMTGGCLCGTIRYAMNASPILVISHCHCSDCRRTAGAPVSRSGPIT